MDDTLVATDRARVRARAVLRRHGIDVRAFEAASRKHWEPYQAGLVDIHAYRRNRWLEVGFPPHQVAAADAAYRAVLFDVRLKRGALRMLREARRRGLKTVILTNGTVDPQRTKLESNRLIDEVDAAVVSEEVGHHKPRPEPFLHALGLVGGDPACAAMVGDNLDADVAGALACGFARVAWLHRGRPVPPDLDPRVVPVVGPAEVLPALLGDRN